MAYVIFKRHFHSPFDSSTVVLADIFGVGGVALITMVIQGIWNWTTYYGCGFGKLALFLLGKLRQQKN
jgi:hypothetical protein